MMGLLLKSIIVLHEIDIVNHRTQHNAAADNLIVCGWLMEAAFYWDGATSTCPGSQDRLQISRWQVSISADILVTFPVLRSPRRMFTASRLGDPSADNLVHRNTPSTLVFNTLLRVLKLDTQTTNHEFYI